MQGNNESNGGQEGQFTSNLGLRRTIPVTAGGCQVSRKGIQWEVLCIEYIVIRTRIRMMNDCSDK
jgi:hypothetical protein